MDQKLVDTLNSIGAFVITSFDEKSKAPGIAPVWENEEMKMKWPPRSQIVRDLLLVGGAYRLK